MNRLVPVLLLAAMLLPAGASAQSGDSERYRLEQLERQDSNDARRVQNELNALLQSHPANLRVVLQADPALMSRPDYLAPYPRLQAFLKAHPEVERNPSFFLGSLNTYWYNRTQTPQERTIDALQAVLAGLAAFIVVMTALIVLASLVRQAVQHRRWLRQSKVQTEVHTKILDRLSSNDELMAYIQTPAGQRFLESGPSPAAAAAEPRQIDAPFGRILWSAQAGVMLFALGVGFWLVQRQAPAEVAVVFNAIGIVAAVLGVGAICSSVLAYVLSSRLGLMSAKV